MITSSPDPRNIIGNVPGRLCVGASDLSLDYPFGGTDLGEIADCAFSVRAPRSLFREETTGDVPMEIVSQGQSFAMFMGLREHNVEAYTRFFVNAEAGASSGFPVVTGFQGANKVGHLHIDDAEVFVFAPYNVDVEPCVVFYAGVPLVAETAELSAMLGGASDEWIVPAVIEATLDASDRDFACGRRLDLSL